jgi:cation transport ATPase
MSSKSSPTDYSVVSAIPGRVRVKMRDRRAGRSWLERWAGWISTADGVTGIDIVSDAASMIVLFDPAARTVAAILDKIDAAVETALASPAPKSGRHRTASASGGAGRSARVRARDLATHPSEGIARVAISSAVWVLAAIPFVPGVVVGAAVVVSAVPTIKKVARDVKSREFSVDELDLLNVALALFEGSYLPAATLTWLINVAGAIKKHTMAHSRRKHAEATAGACKRRVRESKDKTVLLLENALLDDTEFQAESTKLHASLTVPFIGLAGVIALFTRDIGFIAGILRPLYDFAGALKFGVPTMVLNIMAHAATHGPILRSGRAVEKLAKVDAIVFFTTSGFRDKKVLTKRVDQLIERGVHHFLMPTAAQATRVHAIATSRGVSVVVADALPDDPVRAIDLLIRNGHTVAVIEDGNQRESWLTRADIRIGLPGSAHVDDLADIVMTHGDLRGLGHTIDLARRGMRIAKQNLAVSSVAATINLALAIVPPVAATAISTLSTGILATNIRRQLAYNASLAMDSDADSKITAHEDDERTEGAAASD